MVGYHPGIIPVEFGAIHNDGLGEVIPSFPYITQCKIDPRGGFNFDFGDII